MKHVKNIKLQSFRGTAIQVPSRDENMEIIWEDKAARDMAKEDGTVDKVLRELVFQIPGDLMTGQDSIHGSRLYNQIWESLRKEDGLSLSIEDAEWEWAIRKLEDDKIGPKLLHMSHHKVLEQFRALAAEAREEKQATRKARRAPGRHDMNASPNESPVKVGRDGASE